uniref:32 kDa secreted protein n=1 Tax=Babesia microti TaxID=5868 RepID=I0J0E4_BABMI|nr:32 kDa secreted protein [Babesia microti]
MVSFKPALITAFTVLLVTKSAYANGDKKEELKKKADETNKKIKTETPKTCKPVTDYVPARCTSYLNKLKDKEAEKDYMDEKKKELNEKKKKVEDAIAKLVHEEKPEGKPAEQPNIQEAKVPVTDEEYANRMAEASTAITELKTLADEVYRKVHSSLSGDEANTFEHDDRKLKAEMLVKSLNAFDSIITPITTDELIKDNEDVKKMKEAFDEQKKKVEALKPKVEKKDEDYNSHLKDMIAEANGAAEEVKKILDTLVSSRKEKEVEVNEAFFSNLSTLIDDVIATSKAHIPKIVLTLLTTIGLAAFV